MQLIWWVKAYSGSIIESTRNGQYQDKGFKDIY